MFMFMEGLPRAGKSYETCSEYILEAIKKGRPVDAYVEGLNHEKFAELSGRTLEEVQELLVFIPQENVRTIHEYCRKDALVVIDELQDFFPTGRQKLTDEMTTFVTQHGHEGQDIIGMGQDINDVHNIFRRRCDRKFVFHKQDVVGRPAHYVWTSYKGVKGGRDVKFVKVDSGTKKYKDEFFGLYKSHSDGTNNFETFKDDRVNVLNSKAVRLGIPAFVVAMGFAIYYLYGFVSGDRAMVANVEPVKTIEAPKPSTSFQSLEDKFNQSTKVTSTEKEVPKVTYAPPEDYVENIAQKYRLRLGGTAFNPRTKKHIVIIQAFDGSFRLQEKFTGEELLSLGWEIDHKDYGVILHNQNRQYVVRAWPIEPFGKTPSTISNIL